MGNAESMKMIDGKMATCVDIRAEFDQSFDGDIGVTEKIVCNRGNFHWREMVLPVHEIILSRGDEVRVVTKDGGVFDFRLRN